jgi:hypothetical protein
MKHAAFAGSYYDTLGGGSGHLVKGRINEESSVGKAARRKKVSGERGRRALLWKGLVRGPKCLEEG